MAIQTSECKNSPTVELNTNCSLQRNGHWLSYLFIDFYISCWLFLVFNVFFSSSFFLFNKILEHAERIQLKESGTFVVIFWVCPKHRVFGCTVDMKAAFYEKRKCYLISEHRTLFFHKKQLRLRPLLLYMPFKFNKCHGLHVLYCT